MYTSILTFKEVVGDDLFELYQERHGVTDKTKFAKTFVTHAEQIMYHVPQEFSVFDETPIFESITRYATFEKWQLKGGIRRYVLAFAPEIDTVMGFYTHSRT